MAYNPDPSLIGKDCKSYQASKLLCALFTDMEVSGMPPTEFDYVIGSNCRKYMIGDLPVGAAGLCAALAALEPGAEEAPLLVGVNCVTYPWHAPVTLGAGSDAALALVGQELTLADVLTPTEHTAIGNAAPHHAPVTLGAGNDPALALTGQQLTLTLPVGSEGSAGVVQFATQAEQEAGTATGKADQPAYNALRRITAPGGGWALGSGGNTRGANAIDLQAVRSAVTQVASGVNSAIAGGSNNTASGTNSAVAGGNANLASGNYSHAEGASNTASGSAAHAEGDGSTASGDAAHAEGVRTTASVIGTHAEGYQTRASGGAAHAEGTDTIASGGAAHAEGDTTTASGATAHAEGSHTTASGDYSHAAGQSCTASGVYSTIGGGYRNTASSLYGVISGGVDNVASAQGATVAGGSANTASGQDAFAAGNTNSAAGAYASTPGGASAVADKHGQQALAGGSFVDAGDAQRSRFVLRRALAAHTDQQWYDLYLDGLDDLLTVPNDSIWQFRVMLVGLTAGAAQRWSYTIEGTIINDGGTTTLLESVVTDRSESDAAYAAQAVADDANDALLLQVRRDGGSDYNVRWVASIETVEATYPAVA